MFIQISKFHEEVCAPGYQGKPFYQGMTGQRQSKYIKWIIYVYPEPDKFEISVSNNFLKRITWLLLALLMISTSSSSSF